MANKTVNKNTEIVHDFYASRLADPKSLKNKNVCLLALGNAKYEIECEKNTKSALILRDLDNDDPFNGIDFKDINSLKERIENWLKMNDIQKFDLIVMNPPYDGSLHLKILEAVLPFAEKTVNISPNLWFTRRGSKQIKTFRESVANRIVNHVFISTEEAHDLFPDTTSWMSLSILTCSRSNEKCAFDIDNYWKRFYTDAELSILDKVIAGKTLADAKILKKALMLKGVFVPLSFIAGGRGNKPVYKYDGIVVDGKNLDGTGWVESWNSNPKHKKEECQKTECRNDCIKFRTIEEAKNFYDSWNTKFMTWLCGKTVQQQNIKPEYLPYMSDYSQPWTDQRFYEFFKLTPEEIAEIEQFATKK